MNKTEITVKDGDRYFFTTSSYIIENPLGVTKATLKEYSLYEMGNTKDPFGKLYKTNEGNWYDLPTDDSINPLLATLLKRAIDESEKTKRVVDVSL